jgi:hypothetical protein
LVPAEFVEATIFAAFGNPNTSLSQDLRENVLRAVNEKKRIDVASGGRRFFHEAGLLPTLRQIKGARVKVS